MVYARKYGEQLLGFEPSGGLVNGSLVMRDFETDSFWSLMTGEAFTLLGRAHFKQGDYVNSIRAYRRATELDPNAWRAWNGVGVNALNRWVLGDKRDDEAKLEARHAFRRSLRLNNNQPLVIVQMQKWGLQ